MANEYLLEAADAVLMANALTKMYDRNGNRSPLAALHVTAPQFSANKQRRLDRSGSRSRSLVAPSARRRQFMYKEMQAMHVDIAAAGTGAAELGAPTATVAVTALITTGHELVGSYLTKQLRAVTSIMAAAGTTVAEFAGFATAVPAALLSADGPAGANSG